MVSVGIAMLCDLFFWIRREKTIQKNMDIKLFKEDIGRDGHALLRVPGDNTLGGNNEKL